MDGWVGRWEGGGRGGRGVRVGGSSSPPPASVVLELPTVLRERDFLGKWGRECFHLLLPVLNTKKK